MGILNGIKNKLNEIGTPIGDTLQDIFSGPTTPPVVTSVTTTGQTCLERVGMQLRAMHLEQNAWRKNDIEYSKPLVLAEYQIQSEFKVSSTDDLIKEQQQASAEKEMEKAIKKAKKEEKKKEKKEKKAQKKANKVSGVPSDAQPGGETTKTEPVETLYTQEQIQYVIDTVVQNNFFLNKS